MASILLINTANKICSVALGQAGEITHSLKSDKPLSHSKLLASLLKQLLKDAGLGFKNLSAVAINAGPGSYTGLRIGCAMAKAICYTEGLPFIALDHLSIAAHGLNPQKNEPFSIIKLARAGHFYLANYDQSHKLTELKIMEEEGLRADLDFNQRNLLGLGENADFLNFSINKIYPQTGAENMAELAQKSFEVSDFQSVAHFEPFYLQQPFTR